MTRRLWVYYAVALAVVVGTVIVGMILSAAAGAASWGPRCTTPHRAAAITPGTPRRMVERQTGTGQRALADTLVYGISYRTCDRAATLVVLYSHRDTVVSTVYTVRQPH